MATEIERKFLLADGSWRSQCVRQERLRDGLIAIAGDRKVRVRIYADRATLTVKAKTGRAHNAEYEYEIPLADAEEMLASHCDGNLVSKIRHYVPYRGFMWEVDVYEGLLSGIILAEVELAGDDVDVPLPPWIGAEVTGKPEYKKINMFNARLAARLATAEAGG